MKTGRMWAVKAKLAVKSEEVLLGYLFLISSCAYTNS